MKPQLRLITARKWVEADSFDHGCQLDSHPRALDHVEGRLYADAVAVLKDLVRNPGEITPDQVGVIDNNIYQDTKGGQTRTVVDRQAQGRYRATYDRHENANGTVPSEETLAKWKAGEIVTLTLARYEFEFELIFAGLTETQTAELAGATCWN